MTLTKHEVLTVQTGVDALSIRTAIDEVPVGAELTGAEIDSDWGVPTVTLTFRREVTDE